MDFVAIDIETANADQSSICALGLVVFEQNQVVREWRTYVDPQDHFAPFHSGLHGITAEHVVGAPTLPEILHRIGVEHGDAVVVHHGNFDRIAFRRAFTKHGCEPWPCRWLDSAMVARRTWLEHAGAGGYSLKFLARHYGIPLARHHDPLEDARAAGRLLILAGQQAGLSLADWLVRVAAPIGRPRGERPVAAQVLAEVLAHEVIVFTGKLSGMKRSEAETLAREAGFCVGNDVTRETTILVLGEQDVRRLAGKAVSDKQIRAEKAVERGQSIRTVSEADFYDLIAPPAV